MSTFGIIGWVLTGIIVIFSLIPFKRKKRVVVLGQEMADTTEKENERISAGNFGKSPLPDFGYSKWPDEESLINPIENELDLRIKAVCNEYRKADENKKSEIRRSIDQTGIYTLLEFSKRATILGIRRKEPSYIGDGLAAVSMIESERSDYRDVLVALSFLDYGIQKLGLDAKSFFNNALQSSEGKTTDLIKTFSERPADKRKLKTVGGYVAIETGNGIGFVSTYYKKYSPKNNLVEILFRISDLISRDKYRKGNITIGDKIASIWLSTDNDKTIEKYISMASGCASLNTYLKNDLHPKSGVQVLLIYLAEFSEKKDLEILNAQTNDTIPSKFTRLSFTEGNILCLVIQRAVMVGVENYETNESLKRFDIPLREIIKNHN